MALDAARTSHVLCLDVDFELSGGSHDALRLAHADAAEASGGKPVALVVPAFEVAYEHAENAALFMKDKGKLGQLVADGHASGFHVGHFPRGHRATNFDRFFGPARGVYEVEYEACFEPYVVLERGCVPRYDERFRGYGLNKVRVCTPPHKEWLIHSHAH